MEKRGLIIKQFRGNECIIAISGLAISALEGKKEKKKRRAASQLLAPFPLVLVIGFLKILFFRVEKVPRSWNESGVIVEFL